MAHYTATIDSPRSREDVFAYLSDFSSAREWDPGVVEGARLDDGPVAIGSEVRLVTEFLGRRTPFVYRVTALEPRSLVTFRAESSTLVSLDTITFAERPGGGTRVTYDAELTLKGALRAADPLLKLAFGRIGDKARAGLRDVLEGQIVTGGTA